MTVWNGTWKPDGTGGWHTKSDIVEQYNSARLTPAPAQMLKDAIDEVVRLRAENEKLREALSAERERCARVAEQARDDTCDGPVAWSMADGIAAAIRETDNGRD